ncbi:PAS domain-containing sensor histidine kinase [Halopiger aswanensis]|uniref:histidine kinase n=1 Tax=Halopiger aswanensis TaxID=148449 RepID=A0A3R7ECM3_9EURY|nr:PAS domain-containing sensor histidine kinase [Halopiger aswanensis]RKD89090.1 PAS domain S-box-containing protein [Halopiger aswanensis]
MSSAGRHSITEVTGEVTRALLPSSTTDDLQQRVCETFAASALYSFAWIGRYDSAKEAVVPTASAGLPEQTVDEIALTADSPRAALMQEAVRTREITIGQDLVDDSRCEERRRNPEQNDRPWAVIPLVYEESLYGVLQLATDRPHGFGAVERELLAEVGETIAYALELENAESTTRTASPDRPETETETTALPIEAEQERRLYETIISSTPDLVYAFDLDYRFIFANDALLEMWGQTYEESIGNTLRENGYEPWHAEMHEREIDQVVATKEPIRGEVAFEHAERGRRIYDYIFAPVFDAEGDVEAIAGTTRDITERKEAEEALQKSEERFRALVNASSDVVYRMSPDWSEMHQLEGKDFIADTHESTSDWLDKYIHPDDQERVKKAIDDAIRTKSTFELEHRVEQVDGSLGWTFSRAVPMLDDDGTIVEWIGMASDITDRKEYERKLEQTNAQLKRSNKELRRFAHAASHDLQEPLRMVSSYLQLLDNRYGDDLDTEAQEFIEYAVDGADRMRKMVDALLEYSQVNTYDEDFEPVDCETVLEEVRENLQVAIDDHEATITSDDLPTVSGDERQLVLLFQNLIDNAITYAGDDPPDIHVSADRRDDEWKFSIRDNGIGIDPELTDDIFEVFNRLHARDEYPGTGIGLAICKRIVTAHNGRIWAESESEEGTTFFFTVPAENGEGAGSGPADGRAASQ